MTKKFLDDNEVEYDVIDVDLLEGDERTAVVAEVKQLSGGTSLPVLVVDDDVIVGFNKAAIKERLGL
jgi:glutaredoxin